MTELSDILDILLAAAAIYLIVMPAAALIRDRRGSWRILTILGLLVLTYLAFSRLELEVVAIVVGVEIVLLAAGAVLMFAGDLQRFANRVSRLGETRATGSTTDDVAVIETVVDAVVELVRRGWGAIIALRGVESWDRHVSRSIALDGEATAALLVSLFNPSSPAHDGAVMIDGGCVERFAAHLPLTTHPNPQKRHGGTRHAAGLGLSEVCDAVVVVVSEERRTISVAERGVITEVDAVELRERLMASAALHPVPAETGRELALRRLRQAGVALALAIAIWVVLRATA